MYNDLKASNVAMEQFNCEMVLEDYKCKSCDFKTDLRITLHEHVTNSHRRVENHNLNAYNCSNCGFICHSILVFSAHERKCNKQKNNSQSGLLHFFIPPCEETKSQCEYQDRTYDTNEPLSDDSEYKLKVINMAPLIEEYICQKCLFKTKSEQQFMKHIIRFHSVFKPFECDMCSYTTDVKFLFKEHFESIHNKEIFYCNLCEYIGKYRFAFYHHLFTYHTEDNGEEYKCYHCSFKTYYLTCLRRHFNTKHIRPGETVWFECYQCEYRGKTKDILNVHIKSKHTLENLVEYQCDKCSYKDFYQNALRDHIIRKHTKVSKIKWFKCDMCEYRAKIRHNLKRHITYKHTLEGLKPHQCPHCQYTSVYKHSLKEHVLTRHTDSENIKCEDFEETEY